MVKLPHARVINGKLYLRVAHGLTKAEAQKRARHERRSSLARVIPEDGKFSVFRKIRRV